MSTNGAVLGIDFGTTNSTVAHVGPDGKPRVLRDAEGNDKTPSIVYYGPHETLVGSPADALLEGDAHHSPEVRAALIASIKRDLVALPRIGLPGGRSVRPGDVAAEIFAKLKRDAEESLGGSAINRAVVTCPAVFESAQRSAIRDAAIAAGFKEIELLDEPIAAALAFSVVNPIGAGVLVYDFGGGTFDAAFVAREGDDEHFTVALEPDGDARCGGDDIDLALYRFWDERAQNRLGRAISRDPDQVFTPVLRNCRRRKENLSKQPFANFSEAVEGGEIFSSEIDRDTFEELIRPRIDRTIGITTRMAERARSESLPVDTVLLVGGSSQIPMIKRRLEEDGGAWQVRVWGYRDVAVAMGAALHAQQIWPPPATKTVPQPSEPPATTPATPITDQSPAQSPWVTAVQWVVGIWILLAFIGALGSC
jgi:molecular chaperone DnaK (HSP70)